MDGHTHSASLHLLSGPGGSVPYRFLSVEWAQAPFACLAPCPLAFMYTCYLFPTTHDMPCFIFYAMLPLILELGFYGLRLTQLPWLSFLFSLPLIGIPHSFIFFVLFMTLCSCFGTVSLYHIADARPPEFSPTSPPVSLPSSEIALEAATEIIAESSRVAPILSPPADPIGSGASSTTVTPTRTPRNYVTF